MTGIHMQGLFLRHFREVLHGQKVLRPILEHGTVTAVGNQFPRMLRHRRVQIVLDHEHNGSRLVRLSRILGNRTGIHLVIRLETVHVNPTVSL